MFRGSPKEPEASESYRGEQDQYDVSGNPVPGGAHGRRGHQGAHHGQGDQGQGGPTASTDLADAEQGQDGHGGVLAPRVSAATSVPTRGTARSGTRGVPWRRSQMAPATASGTEA